MAYAPDDPSTTWMRDLIHGLETGHGVGPGGMLGNQMHEQSHAPAPRVPQGAGSPWTGPDTTPNTEPVARANVVRSRDGCATEPGLGDELAAFAERIERQLAPLRGTYALGEWLLQRRWPWRLPPAAFGALLGVAMLETRGLWSLLGVSQSGGLATVAAAHAWWLGSAVGGWLGWTAVSIVGGAVKVAARLVALTIALATIAAVLAGVYVVIALFAGWPTPF